MHRNWKRFLIVLVLGLVVMGTTAWLTYPRKPKRSLAELSQYRYMHCPDCKHEGSFAQDALDKPCPVCGSEKGLVPTLESVKGKAESSPYTKMTAALFVEVVVLMGAVWLVLRPRDRSGEAAYLRMRCPKCGQKLRYTEDHIGQAGACRKCKKVFVFPAESLPEEVGSDEEYEEVEG
jgi:ribosomal protein S27E